MGGSTYNHLPLEHPGQLVLLYYYISGVNECVTRKARPSNEDIGRLSLVGKTRLSLVGKTHKNGAHKNDESQLREMLSGAELP